MISHQNTTKVLSFAFNWFELQGLHKSSQGHALYSQEAKTQRKYIKTKTNKLTLSPFHSVTLQKQTNLLHLLALFLTDGIF